MLTGQRVVHVYVDVKLVERLEAMMDRHGITKSDIVRQGIEMRVNELEREPESGFGVPVIELAQDSPVDGELPNVG